MSTSIDTLSGRGDMAGDVPICPDHDVPMLLRGKVGRPTRFHDQTSSEYTLLYFCPVADCGNQDMQTVRRNQAAVPGAAPARPAYSRRNG